MARAWSTTSPSWYSAEPAFCGEDRPRGLCPRVTAVRCFTTHLGIRLRRILSCAASGAAGTRPFGIPSFRGIGVLGFSSCLADTPRRDDRPPTHFFVKKKFIPTCGVGAATQSVPGVLCCTQMLCGAESIPHAGGSFFLYEKSLLRESDCLRGRGGSLYRLNPQLFRP